MPLHRQHIKIRQLGIRTHLPVAHHAQFVRQSANARLPITGEDVTVDSAGLESMNGFGHVRAHWIRKGYRNPSFSDPESGKQSAACNVRSLQRNAGTEPITANSFPACFGK